MHAPNDSPVVEVTGLSNTEFIDRYAGPGRVGLAGGWTLIDRAIRRAQRTLSEPREYSLWSHAFLYSGRRVDGHHWVLESDLEIHHKQIRLGVQENRALKFAEEADYPNLAILDFGLSDDQLRQVMTAGLDLLAGYARYSLRELVGTLIAVRHPTLRVRQNLLAREGSLYCSAMVQHCFASIGLEFAPNVVTKNTTPRDIAATAVPHTTYLLVRQRARGTRGNT